jgi:hypothetical protein
MRFRLRTRGEFATMHWVHGCRKREDGKKNRDNICIATNSITTISMKKFRFFKFIASGSRSKHEIPSNSD